MRQASVTVPKFDQPAPVGGPNELSARRILPSLHIFQWAPQHATGTFPVLLGVCRAHKAEIYTEYNVVHLSGRSINVPIALDLPAFTF